MIKETQVTCHGDILLGGIMANLRKVVASMPSRLRRTVRLYYTEPGTWHW